MYAPIGIFDSGYGGLTVMKNISKDLPHYDYIYLGDNARAPYGDRDFATVYAYTWQCVRWLLGKGCKLVILACNTASAKALRTIQQENLIHLDPVLRVLGVIRPAAEVIGQYTQTGHVGVLGTTGTVQSESYLIEINKFYPDVHVTQEACPLWAPLVEKNELEGPRADALVEQHIRHLLQKDAEIDAVLLACTHYPLLKKTIRKFLPEKVAIVEQGAIVSESLAHYLQRHSELDHLCSRGGTRSFFTTGDADDFNAHGSLFYGQTVDSQHVDV